MTNFNELYDFIDRAERSRKYLPGTAGGLKTALKLFEAELNEDELGSIDTFRSNLDQIYRNVCSSNKNFTSGSLAAYRSRVNKVLTDYDKYGTDPTKMNSWSVPKIIPRQKTKNKDQEFDRPENPIIGSANLNKIELILRPGVKATLLVPTDMTSDEYKRIQAILSSLVVSE